MEIRSAHPDSLSLHYPAIDNPAPGRKVAVAHGVFWLTMPLPFALNHINLWLLRDQLDGRDGWTVVDCGITSEITQQLWEQIFDHELDGLPVLRVIVTHFHPDHLGLAWWLTQGGQKQRWQANLWMSQTEYLMGHLLSSGGGHVRQGWHDSTNSNMTAITPSFYAQQGIVDPNVLAQLSERKTYYPRLVPQVPSSYVRIRHDQSIAIGGHDWQVIGGEGHCPEHCALLCSNLQVMISGDMVLPKISTNVSVQEIEPTGNPLKQFLDSLQSYLALGDGLLILPSHGKPFYGLHTRIAQLQQHHQARLQEVLDACTTQAGSAMDMLTVMFKRPLDLHQLTFALGESLAHLNYLWQEGKLSRHQNEQGVYLFAAT